MHRTSLCRYGQHFLPTLLCGLALALPWLSPAPARGGVYIFAGDSNGLDVVTHPKGYTGTGGPLSVSVCIDPASPNAAAMVTPVQNAIAAVNALAPTTGNLSSGTFNDIPSGHFDFESVLLHEIGHCIGMAHPNLASESGVSGSDRDYTKATKGADTSYDLDSGLDSVRGSSDDVRGDDANLHWFRMANNNPFTLATTVDSTTYARDISALPGSDLFAVNGDRTVAALLGFANTEAVMQQGQYSDEAQRELTHDDVATLRYAMSGLDEIAGTSDDYALTLSYAGVSGSCDLVLAFDNSEASFAACKVSATSISSSNHWRIVGANAYFNTGFNWHFTTPTPGPSPTPAPTPAPTFSLCSAAPATTCLEDWGKGSLVVKETTPGKEKFVAKFSKGPEIAATDFGNPTFTEDYSTCVYDDGGNLVGSISIDRGGLDCGSRPCWQSLGAKGFLYRDRDASADGVTLARLIAGSANKPMILIKAANNARKGQLALPTGIAAGLTDTASVTVQFRGNDAPHCFSMTLENVKKQETDLFKASQ